MKNRRPNKKHSKRIYGKKGKTNMKNRLIFKKPDGTLSTAQWIPAAQTKPPIGEPVLVELWNGTLSTAQWYGDRWQTPYRHSEDVVAWMEIEPYRTAQEEINV